MGDRFGVYHGIVVDTDDPARLFRVRVRVAKFDRQDTPINTLRWSEVLAPFAGPLAGDFSHYQRGDTVYVMYADGDPGNPVVVGGWSKTQGGLNDHPPEMVAEYDKGRRRWTRVDRRGNMVEISENADELHVRLKSGGAEVLLTQRDDSITVKTPSKVQVLAGQATIQSDKAFLDCGDVSLTARKSLAGAPIGKLQILSNYSLDILVQDAAHGGNPLGALNIGQRLEGVGPATPTPVPQQSPVVSIKSAVVNLGTLGGPNELPTLHLNVEAAAEVSVKSAAKVSATAPLVEVKGAQVIINSVDVQIKSTP